MEIGNYYFIGHQDTIRAVQKITPAKTEVQISLEPIRDIPLERIRPLSENDILTLRPPEIPKKQYIPSNKNLENQNLLNDSTLALKPSYDYLLQPATLQPAGLILPAHHARMHSADWFTFMMLLSLILFALVKNSSKKYFNLLFRSITSYPASSRLYREQNVSLIQGSAIMELFYLLILGLFGFQLIKFFGSALQISDFLIFLLCLGAVLLFFMLKHGFYRVLGYISETQTETNEYLFNMKNHNKVLGILLLPLVSFTAWSPMAKPEYFLLTGLALIALFYLFYLFRGVRILIKNHYSIFYLFLYLCTLEFLPLLLMYKILQKQ